MSLSTGTAFLLQALSAGRILVGSSTLILPSTMAQLFGGPSDPSSRIIGRMFGVRDLVVGAYLWRSLANVNSSDLQSEVARENGGLKGTEQERLNWSSEALDERTRAYWVTRQLRHALWMGFICDAVDVCSCVACVLEGDMSGRAIPLIGGGAVAFAMLGALALRSAT